MSNHNTCTCTCTVGVTITVYCRHIGSSVCCSEIARVLIKRKQISLFCTVSLPGGHLRLHDSCRFRQGGTQYMLCFVVLQLLSIELVCNNWKSVNPLPTNDGKYRHGLP